MEYIVYIITSQLWNMQDKRTCTETIKNNGKWWFIHVGILTSLRNMISQYTSQTLDKKKIEMKIVTKSNEGLKSRGRPSSNIRRHKINNNHIYSSGPLRKWNGQHWSKQFSSKYVEKLHWSLAKVLCISKLESVFSDLIKWVTVFNPNVWLTLPNFSTNHINPVFGIPKQFSSFRGVDRESRDLKKGMINEQMGMRWHLYCQLKLWTHTILPLLALFNKPTAKENEVSSTKTDGEKMKDHEEAQLRHTVRLTRWT